MFHKEDSETGRTFRDSNVICITENGELVKLTGGNIIEHINKIQGYG